MPRRILVTGGRGFLGSHVVKALRMLGDEVFAPTHAEYDLVHAEDVRRIYDDIRPNVVIHLAARVGGIGANADSPGSFFYENLMMGTQMLHEAFLRGVDKFVTVGTVCAYPRDACVPFREVDIWDGYPEETNAPYGLAKKMLLVQSQAYRKQYGFNSIVLFPTNLYGPGDNFDLRTSHVIPAMISKMVEAKAQGATGVTMWGDGSPTRDFLYVTDAVGAIISAASWYDSSEPLNIGSGVEVQMSEIALLISHLVGFEGEIEWDASKPNGQPRRCLDVSRMHRDLGYTESTPLEDGLRETITWYLQKLGGEA